MQMYFFWFPNSYKFSAFTQFFPNLLKQLHTRINIVFSNLSLQANTLEAMLDHNHRKEERESLLNIPKGLWQILHSAIGPRKLM